MSTTRVFLRRDALRNIGMLTSGLAASYVTQDPPISSASRDDDPDATVVLNQVLETAGSVQASGTNETSRLLFGGSDSTVSVETALSAVASSSIAAPGIIIRPESTESLVAITSTSTSTSSGNTGTVERLAAYATWTPRNDPLLLDYGYLHADPQVTAKLVRLGNAMLRDPRVVRAIMENETVADVIRGIHEQLDTAPAAAPAAAASAVSSSSSSPFSSMFSSISASLSSAAASVASFFGARSPAPAQSGVLTQAELDEIRSATSVNGGFAYQNDDASTMQTLLVAGVMVAGAVYLFRGSSLFSR